MEKISPASSPQWGQVESHITAGKFMSDKLRNLRVMIVDDNEGDRILYKELLTEGDPGTGFTFDEAGTGSAALEKMRSEKPECLLLDYRLPDMHGLDILKELADQDGSLPVPVVMLTGFGDEATAVKALHLGAQEYLPKQDLTGPILCKAMDDAIKTHSKNRELEDSRRQLEMQNRELAGKYAKVEEFYQRVLEKLKRPVTSSRNISCKILDELEGTLSDEQVTSLESIKQSCDELTANINNLIDTTGIQMGELLISPRPEIISEVISGVVNKFKPQATFKQIELLSHVSGGLPEISMDRYRIEQVLTNLLDNAIKFTGPGGKIEINVSRLPESRDSLTILISDTGKGVQTEHLEKIFEHSFQAPTAGGENQTGLGLGLHICREILLSHKGNIFATSIPGEGCCFTITLPLPMSETTDMSKVDVWSAGTIEYP
jgi:signal transduction histidine kinase